jgi:tape measure domain-containing protein
MSERELPPLRVRIIGDDSQLRSAISNLQNIANTASAGSSRTPSTSPAILAARVSAIGTKAAAVAAGTATKAAATAAGTATKAAATAAATTTKANAIAAATTTKANAVAASTATKAAATAAGTATKAAATAAATTTKAYAAATGTLLRSSATATGTFIRSLSTGGGTLMRSAATAAASVLRSLGSGGGNLVRSAGMASSSIIRAIATGGGNLIRSAATAASTYRSSSAIVIRAQAAADAARMRAAAAVAAMEARTRLAQMRGASSGRGRTSGLGGGLTSRADIYMHANAIRSLSQTGRGIVDLAMDFDKARVGIEAFTGSARSAGDVLLEIQDYAIVSPYNTLQLADAARNMMAYGLSARNAIDSLKMLGDVAGGDAQRLNSLSYAMSQITSMGKLQGQELRQLTEQGFNPLQIIAEKTKRPMETAQQAMARVTAAMHNGAVTAKDVAEALKVATTGSGKFAGMADRMNKSLPGLVNQIKELGQKIGLRFMAVFEEDMKNALTKVIDMGKAISAWMENPANQEMLTTIARTIKLAFMAVVAFHAVGLAVASVRWWLSSIVSTVAPLVSLFKFIVAGAGALIPIFSFLISPVGLVVAGVVALGGAILYYSGAGSAMLSYLSSSFKALAATVLPVLQTIFKALQQGQFQEAGKLAMLGLELAFRVGFQNIYGIYRGFISGFMNAWTNMYTGIASVGINAYVGIANGFTDMVVTVQNAFSLMYNSILTIWDNLKAASQKAWIYIKSFFSSAIDYNAEAAKIDKETAVKAKERGKSTGQVIDERLREAEKIKQSRTAQASGMIKIMEDEANAQNKIRDDAAVKDTEAFQTRIDDIKTEMKDITQVIKRGTEEMGPPKPEDPKGPDYKGQFSAMGASSGAKAFETAMSRDSSEYTKKLAEQSDRMRSMQGSPQANPQVVQQIATNTLLGKILTALNSQSSVVVQPAGVGKGTTP